MTVTTKNNWQQQAAFILVLLIIISLFISRAALTVLSVAMIFFIWKEKFSSFKTIIVSGLCIMLPVIISGLWSEDKSLWGNCVLVKIPLFTFCIGMMAAKFTAQQIKIIVWVLTIAVLAGCMWSLFQFFTNEEQIIKNYLVAKVMPAPLDDDHIRFSWLVSLTCIVLCRQLTFQSNKTEKIIGFCIIFLFVIYLHFLASKTGLLCLYVSVLLLLFSFLFNRKNHKKGVLLLIGIVSIFVIAYYSFPTLKNRIQYVLYDFNNYSKGKFEQGSSDGARVLSMKAGWNITQQNPITGVGFGDIKQAIDSWHQQYHSSSLEYERFNPTNEWLLYGAGSGFAGMLLFTIGIFLLMRLLYSKNIFSIILITSLLIPLITDDSLEGQFGVTIFSIIFCLGYYFNRQTINSSSVNTTT
jgi:O-antigen ligase